MLTIGKQLTADERLSKSIVAIMGNPKYTALAGVLMLGEKTIDEDCPTACTNGRDEKYGREFVEGLTDAELRGLVLHENYHKLYSHLTTWRHLYNINAQLANVACDYVINLKIMDDNKDGFATLPEGALLDSKYRGMDTAQVFNLLKKDMDEDDEDGATGEDGRSGSGDNESEGDGEQPSGAGQGTGFDEHDWDGAQELSDEEKRELARDIDEAIRQAPGKTVVVGQVITSQGVRELVSMNMTGMVRKNYPTRRNVSWLVTLTRLYVRAHWPQGRWAQVVTVT